MHLLIQQATIIDTASTHHGKVADILIEDGVIKTIAASIDVKADKVVKADGLHASIGWVDVLADYREPGYEHKETIANGLKVAAAGGFTHVLLAPNTNAPVTNKPSIQFILQKANGNVVSLHPLGAASQNVEGKVLSEMLDMYHHGAIAFTDGWKPIQNAGLMLKALEYVKAFDGTLIQIPVDNALSAGGLMHEGPVSTHLGMAGLPEMAETLIIHRDIELLKYTGSKLHITGVSSAASVEMIRKAKAEGVNITCSVTPYHLAFTDEALRSYSSMYKVSPPLRTEADRQALIAGVKDGTIDCIASHHRPQEWDAKEKEFEYAAEGMNVQEIAFSIIWEAAGEAIGLDKLVAALGMNARAIFSLQKPAIAVGEVADITLFTTTGTTTVERMVSLSANNPFIGKSLAGKVLGVINNNTISNL